MGATNRQEHGKQFIDNINMKKQIQRREALLYKIGH